MKKNYVKPEAEYINLEAQDIITVLGPGGDMDNDDDFGGWDDNTSILE